MVITCSILIPGKTITLPEAKSLAARQQTLSQVISKDAAILSTSLLNPEDIDRLKDSLSLSLINFQHQQEKLSKETAEMSLPVPQTIFEIKLLFSSANIYYKGILAVGKEMTQSDSALLSMNRSLYLREMMSNEQKYSPLMGEITQKYAIS